MTTTPQTQLINLANGMCALMQNWRGDLQTAQDLANQYINLSAGTGFAAMPTTTTNADGSLATNADGTPAEDPTPVADHVIDNRKISTLEVAISSYDLGVVFGILQQFVNLFEGTAVTTQNYAPAMLAATASESYSPGP